MSSLSVNWRSCFKLAACVVLSLAIVLSSGADAEARKRKVFNKSKRGTVSAATRAASGTADPRYADIIMNPVTGEIYHQVNADGQRYPASLTKMMTLYLLFEALEQNKVSMNTHLDISDYAATMPQTNLSLQPGDTIPVEIAIKALVVRSANDVAVVVGESLGGSAERFAQMMTNKARALGMRGTIFKNPNGLPNNGQVTTARDMAKLGIALKRDFPQYYDYFATRQFSWNGVTYYTHNRVMLRYAGTDGIKTGYIGLSGFNVVSSVTRGGRPLVGTVMGGMSGAWRDNRMIELLDTSYRTIAERGAARGKMYPENLPLKRNPKTGQSRGVGLEARGFVEDPNAVMPSTLSEERSNSTPGDMAEEEPQTQDAYAPQVAPTATAQAAASVNAPVTMEPHVAPQAAPQAAPVAVEAVQAAPQASNAPNNYIRVVSVPPKVQSAPAAQTVAATTVNSPFKPQVTAPVVPQAPAAPVGPARVTTPIPAAAIAKTASRNVQAVAPAAGKGGTSWGVQVGAFSSNELATRAVNDAYALANQSLAGAQMAIAAPEKAGAPVYRARMGNINEAQAKAACQVLIAHSTPCFAYKTK